MREVIFFLMLGSVFTSCRAQIYKDLEGCWLPENYVSATADFRSKNKFELLFPVEVLQIIETDARKFARDYNSDLQHRDTITVDDFILIRTFNSEMNSYSIERVHHEGLIKYKVIHLSYGLNMNYVSPTIVDTYKDSEIYISKKRR